MKCTCVSDIEKKVRNHLVEQGKLKKPVIDVSMGGTCIQFKGGQAVLRTVNCIEITLEGQKKKETMNMMHTFCPFCGVKQEDAE